MGTAGGVDDEDDGGGADDESGRGADIVVDGSGAGTGGGTDEVLFDRLEPVEDDKGRRVDGRASRD